MQLAAEVSELDEGRQRAVACRGNLGRPLAKLRRNRLIAEVPVEAVLGRVRDDLTRLDVRDPVLGDREPAALRVLAERDVVVLRAREVLEQVAVALGGNDAQIEALSVVQDDRRLRVAARHHLGYPVALAERLDERRWIARRSDEIEVAHGLAPTAHAPRFRDGDRGRVRLERGGDAPHRGKSLSEEAPRLRLLADAGLERLQDLLLTARAHARELAKPAVPRRGLQAVERRDAELRPDARGGLRPHTREPEEVDDTGRDEPPALGERVHLPVLDDLDDLRLDRLADAGQLLGLPLERELGDRDRRLTNPPCRAPVRDDLERLLLEDLREVCEQLELIRELAVSRQRLRHPAMIRTCLAPSSASRPTTSARTSKP